MLLGFNVVVGDFVISLVQSPQTCELDMGLMRVISFWMVMLRDWDEMRTEHGPDIAAPDWKRIEVILGILTILEIILGILTTLEIIIVTH